MSAPAENQQPASRPIQFWEMMMIKGNAPMLIAIEFKDQAATNRAISILTRSMPAFNLMSEGDNLVSIRTPPELMEMPGKDIIKTCEDAIKWIGEIPPFDPTKRLGMLAKREDMIVMSVSHAVTDGTSARFWVAHCLDEKLEASPILPLSMDIYFKELAKTSSHDFPSYIKCATVHYKSEPTENKHIKLPWSYIEIPAEKLACFDKKLNRPHKLTERIWAAMILAISSYNGKFDRVGSVTSVDLRRFTENPNDVGLGLFVSGFAVSVTDITLESTIEELGDSMRKEFDRLIGLGIHFSRLDFESHFEPSDGPVADIANLGPIVVDDKVEDFAISALVPYVDNNEFYNMSYSKIHKDKNIFFMRTSYVPCKLPPNEIESLRKKMEYILTSVSSTTKIGDALNEIEKI